MLDELTDFKCVFHYHFPTNSSAGIAAFFIIFSKSDLRLSYAQQLNSANHIKNKKTYHIIF